MSTMTSHNLGLMHAVHLAQVIDNADPDARGRIKIRLLANNIEIWSSVVVASAGQNYGVCCLPKIDETVVVTFITPEQPMVLGSVWAGQNSAPVEADPIEDHYVIRTPLGTIMEFDDVDGPKVEIKTPNGHSVTITDGEDGFIEIKRGGQKVKMNSSEVKISGSKIVLDASTIEMNAAMVQINAGITQCSGVVQADTLISTSVVGTTYTPGAGNIW